MSRAIGRIEILPDPLVLAHHEILLNLVRAVPQIDEITDQQWAARWLLNLTVHAGGRRVHEIR